MLSSKEIAVIGCNRNQMIISHRSCDFARDIIADRTDFNSMEGYSEEDDPTAVVPLLEGILFPWKSAPKELRLSMNKVRWEAANVSMPSMRTVIRVPTKP